MQEVYKRIQFINIAQLQLLNFFLIRTNQILAINNLFAYFFMFERPAEISPGEISKNTGIFGHVERFLG